MSARIEIEDAIEAVQTDRRAAHDAGETKLSSDMHELLVKPLNQQRARMVLEPQPEDTELRQILATLDAGLAALPGAPAALTANTRAAAEQLRLKISGGGAPQPSVNPDIPDTPPAAALDSPDPPPAGEPGPFIGARKSTHLTIVYVDAKGRDMLRQGGSRSWRNNNPGNIRRGNFADAHGAIGDDGAFAIFPDEPIGFKAIVSLLRTPTYSALTLEGAINRYAPPSENQTSAYVKFVTKQTGIAKSKILGELKADKIRAIANAIKAMEGWKPGSEQPNRPMSGLAATGASGGISSAVGAAEEWMRIAEREAALPPRERSEWPDPEENPRILEYFRVAASWFEHEGDETDWCAAFVNFCLVASGHVGTDHPGARSFFWNKKNQFIKLDGPRKGSIAVRRYAPFSDPKWKTGKGHVGFVVSSTETTVTLLGGNQNKTVCHKTFPLRTQDSNGNLDSEFVAFMMPVMN